MNDKKKWVVAIKGFFTIKTTWVKEADNIIYSRIYISDNCLIIMTQKYVSKGKYKVKYKEQSCKKEVDPTNQ